jgi:hypothetical protein
LYPFWENTDQVTHSVVFSNGLCSLELAPGTAAGCNSHSWWASINTRSMEGLKRASWSTRYLPPP